MTFVENYLLGRKKSIWLSVSNDLKYDAERDLRDIGAKKINVYPLNKVVILTYFATKCFCFLFILGSFLLL